MRTIKVRYTFEIEKTVTISGAPPPSPYSQEEWEEQQIQNAGDELAWAMEGSPSMSFRVLG